MQFDQNERKTEGPMEVTIESSFFQEPKKSLQLENKTSIKDLLLQHASILAVDPTLIAIVNGRVEKHTYVLHDGDHVRFVHLPAGG